MKALAVFLTLIPAVVSAQGESNPLKAGNGHVLVQGRKVPIERFLKNCRKTTGKAVDAGSMSGRNVKLTGIIEAVNRAGVVITCEPDTSHATAVAVDMRDVGGLTEEALQKFQPGHQVDVYGIGEDQGVRGWFLFLSPPGLRWQYKLRRPEIVVAGDVQTFAVDCVVKNTGTQPLENVEFTARLWQVASPNDELESYVLRRLDPGESARFTIPFEIYNYQAIGWTSVPNCEGTVTGYEIGKVDGNR